MANKVQLGILKNGVEAWNGWRKNNPDVAIDLCETDLIGAELSGISLFGADLSGTDLQTSNLYKADLSGTDLSGSFLSTACLTDANLTDSDLGMADLRGTDFGGALLRRADLSGALIFYTNFNGANLDEANLCNASFGHTILGNVDLSTAKELETIIHVSPSSIGIDTIYKSKGKIPQAFLRGCGVPENFIAFIHSLTDKAFDFHSCFISHSTRDKAFCKKLYADLQAKGVRTWYFPEDAKWGEPVWGEIDRGIKIYDKLVIVLSENSLQSKPVLREVQRSLDREDKEHKNILFPIRIDDYIFDKWEHERKADVLEKVVGDFSGWDTNAAKYQKAFDKLLKGLQAEDRKE